MADPSLLSALQRHRQGQQKKDAQERRRDFVVADVETFTVDGKFDVIIILRQNRLIATQRFDGRRQIIEAFVEDG